MVDEIARLGVTFDATQVVAGKKALDDLGASAKPASTAVDDLSNSSQEAAASVDEMGNASQEAAAATTGLGKAAADASAAAVNLEKTIDKTNTTLPGAARGAKDATAGLIGLDAAARTTRATLDQINRTTGAEASLGSYAARNADIQAYGAELDRLRARFDPLFAAGQRYKTVLAEIDNAERVGAISASTAIQARLRETASYNEQISKLNSLADAKKRAAQAAVNQQSIVPDRGADIQAYGKAMDDLRAKYNPLFAAQRDYRKELTEINKAAKVGAITEKERVAAISSTKAAFAEQVRTLHSASDGYSKVGQNAKNATTQVGLARHELINLSRQGQDLFVSLQAGQSPLTVLVQQGSQIADIFASSKGSLKEFGQQALGWMGRIFTASRLTVGGLAAVAAVAATATVSWNSAQRQVQLGLMGIGRVSQATVGDINRIADATSSLRGLSVSQARETATALAATGKIGVENIEKLTAQTRNFAAILNVDVEKAAEVMAQVFSNPTEGAKQLANRIGGIDIATINYIETLEKAGRRQEAINVLFEAIAPSIDKASEKTGTLSKGWNTFTNLFSDGYTAIGRFFGSSGLSGLAAKSESELESLRKAAEETIATFQSQQRLTGVNFGPEIAAQMQTLNAINELLMKIQANKQKAGGLGADQLSLQIGPVVDSIAPANMAIRSLTATVELLAKAMSDPAFEALRQKLGEQLPLAAARAQNQLNALQANPRLADPIQSTIDALAIQNRLLTDQSPKMRQQVAYQLAYNDAIKQGATAAEAAAIANARGKQAYGGTATDIQLQQQYIGLLGQTATAEQAVLQVRLQRQAAALQGVHISDQQAAVLERLAREQANGVAQIKASADAQRVEAATIGMSVGAAAEYTAVQNALNAAKQRGVELSPESIAAIRNEAASLGQAAAAVDNMRWSYSNLIQGPLQTLQQSIASGSSFFDALKKSGISALNAIASKLMDMAAQNLWKAAFGGGGGGGGLLSLLGLGSGFGGGPTMGFAGLPAIHHSGYGPGDRAPTRFVNPVIFNDAPRFHSGIGPGERAAIITDDESVLTPGQMRQLAPVGSGITVHGGDTHITIQGSADNTTVTMLRKELAKRDAEFEARVAKAVKKADHGRWLR